MAHYESVNGIYRKVNKIYSPVDGIYRDVKKRYNPVDGVYRQTFSGGGMTVGDLAVGDVINMVRWGKSVPCIVLHHGKPSPDYDDSCDGTWCMTGSILQEGQWDAAGNAAPYAESNANTICANWAAMLDEPYWNAVKTVNPPCNSSFYLVNPDKAKELAVKAFLLSATEVGVGHMAKNGDAIEVGAPLEYFADCAEYVEPKRVAYLNGTATTWWTRTENYTAYAVDITADGMPTAMNKKNSRGIRPAFILDSSTPIDPEGHWIIP